MQGGLNFLKNYEVNNIKYYDASSLKSKAQTKETGFGDQPNNSHLNKNGNYVDTRNDNYKLTTELLEFETQLTGGSGNCGVNLGG